MFLVINSSCPPEMKLGLPARLASPIDIYMLVDELTRSQERAPIQAEKRNARHEGRFCLRPKLLHSLSSTQAVTSSIIPM